MAHGAPLKYPMMLRSAASPGSVGSAGRRWRIVASSYRCQNADRPPSIRPPDPAVSGRLSLSRGASLPFRGHDCGIASTAVGGDAAGIGSGGEIRFPNIRMLIQW